MSTRGNTHSEWQATVHVKDSILGQANHPFLTSCSDYGLQGELLALRVHLACCIGNLLIYFSFRRCYDGPEDHCLPFRTLGTRLSRLRHREFPHSSLHQDTPAPSSCALPPPPPTLMSHRAEVRCGTNHPHFLTCQVRRPSPAPISPPYAKPQVFKSTLRAQHICRDTFPQHPH